MERILAHQRSTGQRFGEAAVALGLVAEADVAQALSHQFRYPYTPAAQSGLSPELVVAGDPSRRRPRPTAASAPRCACGCARPVVATTRWLC